MILSIFLFFLFFALGLFILGFFYSGELKFGRQIFQISSSFMILMCGLLVLSQGLDFKSGSIVNTVNSTTTNITYSYTHLAGSFQGSYGLSAILIIISLGLFFYSIVEVRTVKNRRVEYSEEEE